MKAGEYKLRITVVGRVNVGKSLLINSLFNSRKSKTDYSFKIKTDSKAKSAKLLPNGSFVIIDKVIIDNNADFDSIQQVISKSDFFIIVLDAREELNKCETELVANLQKNHAAFLIAINKIEYGTNPHLLSVLDALKVTYFELSCKEDAGLESFRKNLIYMLLSEKQV